MKKNSDELLGDYGLADGRLDIDFQRDSVESLSLCWNFVLNKDKDGRKGERRE